MTNEEDEYDRAALRDGGSRGRDAFILSRIEAALARMETIEGRVDMVAREVAEQRQDTERISSEIGGTSPSAPGLALRLDRIEQMTKRTNGMTAWLLGGGGVGTVAFLIMLYRALVYLSKIEGQ